MKDVNKWPVAVCHTAVMLQQHLLLTYLYFLFMVTLTAWALADPSDFLPCVKTMSMPLTFKNTPYYISS